MFDKTKYQFRLWRLQNARDRLAGSVERRVNAAVRRKESSHFRGAIRDEAQFDFDEIDEDINTLTTRYYLSLARRRFVDVPQDEETWNVSETFGSRFLTPAGVTKIRTALHAERKERWEIFQSHTGLIISLVASLTGVLGAVIGVLSFLKGGPPK
ncbi:hypothetical protein IVB08_26595 [Bradyrhizobium sp. 173]|uniref:hypothetical protein n=1 Tax=Bradyrhizobium sp. 173 TaxID=2782644 RepID=UPI001FF711D3|nr:hypothetical protein [Bradyrhizobium sp. 173]MCK1567484.1 hypothetical protein [Bradyrhizobium sp. 173]